MKAEEQAQAKPEAQVESRPAEDLKPAEDLFAGMDVGASELVQVETTAKAEPLRLRRGPAARPQARSSGR